MQTKEGISIKMNGIANSISDSKHYFPNKVSMNSLMVIQEKQTNTLNLCNPVNDLSHKVKTCHFDRIFFIDCF